MARATSDTPKSVGRPRIGRLNASKTRVAPTRAAAKLAATPAAGPASKEELRARVEKLERANATLRVKNKELRLVAVEAAEQVDALTLQLASSERRAVRQGRHEAPAEAVATREITRPTRAKRKARASSSEDDIHGDNGRGDDQTDWSASDHAEA
jgi:hypothetical protein